MDTHKEVIDKCPDEKPIAMMEYCVNKDLDYTSKKCLNNINGTGVDKEGGETKDIENEYVIHIDINKNELKIN